MKKLGYLFILTIIMLVSCNGTSGSKGDSTSMGSAPGLTKDGDTKTEAAAGKPEHLTAQTFKKKIMDYDKNPQQWVFEGDKPAIVDFYADWCRPCKMLSPILEDVSNEYQGRIDVYKVNTDQQRELASVFGITSLPSVLFIPMQGKPSLQKGYMPKETVKKIIDEYLLKPTAKN